MSTFIVLGKDEIVIPIDIMSSQASKEIEAYTNQGFSILSDSCEAEDAEEAMEIWQTQLYEKTDYDSIKTSSTNLISDKLSIIDNHGVITSTIVIGTNLFSDFFAGVRDVVGGKSGSYMNKLDKLKSEVLLDLKRQAAAKKCNAIIGISIDVNEISGGNKSMLMVTGVGTCVLTQARA
ncbi:YbjQ family protein [Vibrio parahaemolyticus]|nr:heavy metal-binding domain-containing protein [Vibrio parahaemolyticus]